MISDMRNPALPVSAFNCTVGQRIRNRGNSHIGHNNCRCRDTSSGVVMAVQRMAVIRPSLPKLYRRLPGAQSSHCYGDALIHKDNSRGVLCLKRAAGKNEIYMIGSHIVATDRNDQQGR